MRDSRVMFDNLERALSPAKFNPVLLGVVMLTLVPLAIAVVLWKVVYVAHFAVVLVGGAVVLSKLSTAVRARGTSATGLLSGMSLALVIVLPWVPFDLVALGWLYEPELVDASTLAEGSSDSLEGTIRLGPDVYARQAEAVELAGQPWEVWVIDDRRALVVRGDRGRLADLVDAPLHQRLARVTSWSQSAWQPKSKPRAITVARKAKSGSRTELAIEWRPDADRWRAWAWLLGLLLVTNLVWLGYVRRVQPGPISLQALLSTRSR